MLRELQPKHRREQGASTLGHLSGLGRPLSSEEWVMLRQLDDVRLWEAGAGDIEHALWAVRNTFAALGRPISPQTPSPTLQAGLHHWDDDTVVFSALVACEVERHDREFLEALREQLGRRDLSRMEARDWLAHVADTERQHARKQAADNLVDSLPWDKDPEEIGYLELELPGSNWPFVLAYHLAGGMLDSLSQYLDQLCERTRWTRRQGLVFALCGEAPIIPPVCIRVESHPHYRSLDRVHLDVDPRVSPRELMEQYSQIRQRLLSRHRPLSDAHRALALFTAVERTSDADWEHLMQKWNQDRVHHDPARTYDRACDFRRDCLLAVKRMLRPVDRRAA